MRTKINQQNAQINSGLICAFCWFIFVLSNLETWEPSQHSLVDTVETRKTCVEVAGCRTFRILTSSQQCGI